MNPIHSKSLTAKLEFIPLFTTGRCITAIFCKALTSSIFLPESFDSKLESFAREYVYIRTEEALLRNLVLFIPVIGQIIILADEILMRISVNYFIFRSGDYGNRRTWAPAIFQEPAALEALSSPIPKSFLSDPRVVTAMFRAHRLTHKPQIRIDCGGRRGFPEQNHRSDMRFRTPFSNAGELRANKAYISDLLENPPFREFHPKLSKDYDFKKALNLLLNFQGSYRSAIIGDEDSSDDVIFSAAYLNMLYLLFAGMDESLRNDRLFVEKFLEIHPFLYNFLSDELKNDSQISDLVETRIKEILYDVYSRPFKPHRSFTAMIPDRFLDLNAVISAECKTKS